MQIFQNYDWTGNVRELRNEIERICTLHDVDTILPEHLSTRLLDIADSKKIKLSGNLRNSVDDFERELIQIELKKNGGNIQQAAKTLGISRQTLYDKLKKHSLMFS